MGRGENCPATDIRALIGGVAGPKVWRHVTNPLWGQIIQLVNLMTLLDFGTIFLLMTLDCISDTIILNNNDAWLDSNVGSRISF